MLDFLGWAPHGAETSKKNGPGASECPLEHTNVVAKATPVKQILARYTLIKPSVQPHRDGRGDQNRLWDDPWRSAPRHRDLLLRGLDVSNFSPLSSRPERIIATQQGESIQLRPLLKPKPGLSGHPPISAEARSPRVRGATPRRPTGFAFRRTSGTRRRRKPERTRRPVRWLWWSHDLCGKD